LGMLKKKKKGKLSTGKAKGGYGLEGNIEQQGRKDHSPSRGATETAKTLEARERERWTVGTVSRDSGPPEGDFGFPQDKWGSNDYWKGTGKVSASTASRKGSSYLLEKKGSTRPHVQPLEGKEGGTVIRKGKGKGREEPDGTEKKGILVSGKKRKADPGP